MSGNLRRERSPASRTASSESHATRATHEGCLRKDEPVAPTDPLWPNAASWLALPSRRNGEWVNPDFIVVGMPTHQRSISPTAAHRTPQAVRTALRRYSTWAAHRGSHGVDISELVAADVGNISNPDGPDGFERSVAIFTSVAQRKAFTVVLGGDNSVTYPAMLGLMGSQLQNCALITFDAHHDLRDGWSNGSPVRQLIEAGLPGSNIVQVGIAGFANSKAYHDRARELGIHVISREQCHQRTAQDVIAEALSVLGDKPTYLDVDVDVCDRAVAPGCPASSPGGLSAQMLRDLVFHAVSAPQVRAMDVTEVDATADAADGRTVRLAALCVLEAAAAIALRTTDARERTIS